MKITIEIPDSAAEMLKDMAEALRTIAETAKIETTQDAEKIAQAIVEKANPVRAKKSVSLEEVRAIMAELLREAGKEAVQDLLKKHGAKKLTEISAEHYAELKAEAEELLKGLKE